MERRTRKPNRLKNYDYSQEGAYSITICTKQRVEILWDASVGANRVRPEITNFTEYLSDVGIVVNNVIQDIPKKYNNMILDKYVIMPNHIHMIILITDEGVGDGRTRFAPTISRAIKQTKGKVTKLLGYSIWQRSFHDHIIRNETEYLQLWKYIDENPMKWELDDYYNDVGANRVRP